LDSQLSYFNSFKEKELKLQVAEKEKERKKKGKKGIGSISQGKNTTKQLYIT